MWQTGPVIVPRVESGKAMTTKELGGANCSLSKENFAHAIVQIKPRSAQEEGWDDMAIPTQVR